MRAGKMISENYKIALITLIILIFIVAIAPSNFAVAQEVSNPKLIKVFIGFVTTPGPAEKALVRAFGGNIRHTYRIIPAISAELPETVIPGLKLNPNVTTIEPVIKAYLINTNEDELNNTWGVKRIGSGVAHLNGYLGTGIKVAVIDSGVDYNHVDLAANFAGGYDFADADDDPMDFHSHGTHVAGTIAAIRNETGVIGAAPEVEIYALKVFSDYGSSANYDDIVAAIQWSVDNGIQVTNNSYGSLSNPGAFVQSAFDNAYDAGVLHVAAAGNETKGNQKNNVIYPAKFASVIAVSASDSNDIRAGFSSNGPEVELIAPGVSINSTVLNSTYGFKSGTSMASPHVAGVAALVWSANSSMSNAEIREALKNNAEDLGLTFNDQGYGLVRADLALALSSDASLFALEVTVGILTPAFDPTITGYTVAVAHDTVSIDITRPPLRMKTPR